MKFAGCFFPIAIAVAALTPGVASADIYSWTFAGTAISGSGTLTAIASGTAGLDYITSGSGHVDYNGTTLAVTFGLCGTPGSVCTFTDTDGGGANLTIDNWLYPSNPPGSELTANGIALTPTPDATPSVSYLGVWDLPSQYFYDYNGGGGVTSLSTPFTVTPFTATPEPGFYGVLALGLSALATVFSRRKKA